MSVFDVRIPGLPVTVVQADGNDIVPVTVDQFRISVAETYDVIVQPTDDRAYAIFAEAEDRTGYARGALAPRAGMAAPIPAMDPRPLRTMADMGMAGMEAEPHTLAGAKQRRPVGAGRMAIDQIGVGGARDVEDVGRAHAHLAPREPILKRLGEALTLGVFDECAQRALVKIVIIALEFEIADDRVGVLVGPVRQHHHVIAVETLRVAPPGFDDDLAP
jgi:FtsP/CotA-like multicopper oxidase with cupredoxin domain